jgi:hypothetical protein
MGGGSYVQMESFDLPGNPAFDFRGGLYRMAKAEE